MNFIVTEMTFMRYFMPLILEGNRRSIKSRIFIAPNSKYNNPFLFREVFEEINQKHGVDILNLSQVNEYPDKTFLIEGCGIDSIKYDKEKYCITYMTDFTTSYERYINQADRVILPSKALAEHYKKISDKNLYLGSPKYDVKLNKNNICKKYNLDDSKKALVIFPRRRDLHKVDLNKIYRCLREVGYKILVKTRGKDPVQDEFRGEHYFLDDSWYPHTTMELIEISDLVVNFSSTSIKECVLLKTPVINFDIKPFNLLLSFLYDYPYCKQMKTDFSSEELTEVIQKLTEHSHEEFFNEAIEKYLFEREGTSSRILDSVGIK
tara:strand:- start:151 stop:1113 length:963 start_codon:yes stop_codon:yes gene_type:complete